MNLIVDAFSWLTDPDNWTGHAGIPTRVAQHVLITLASVVMASIIALPAGVFIGHTQRGIGIVGALAGAVRAIPTLGLLTVFGLVLGIGLQAPMLALIVLAVPSLLAGGYAGVQAIDRNTINAARAIGMSTSQLIRNVELPLASPVILGGVRTATLQVVATATLAAYTSDYGLGRYVFTGLKSRDYAEMLGGALLVIAIALILELFLAVCQRLARTRIADPRQSVGLTSADEAQCSTTAV